MPTITEAIMEANASVAPDDLTYFTIELEHPTFDQPVYAVTNVPDDMEFGIEAGADPNQGQMVSHKAVPFKSSYPEQREGQAASCQVSIDNVERLLLPKIKAAMSIRSYIRCTYREYVESDLSEPSYGPVQFVLAKVSVKAATLTGTLIVGNIQNKRFPRLGQDYSTTRFRSLLPG